MPYAKAMQYNTELLMHFQPVDQGKALLLSGWQTSSVVSSPGGELQTASEADSTASPFHTWWACLMPAPEDSAEGIPQTSGLRTSSCLAAACDHRKKLKIEHLLAAVERPGRPCLPLRWGKADTLEKPGCSLQGDCW